MRGSTEALVIPPRILAGDFAGWLRDAMAERRMSYRMVAIQAGIDHTSVYRLTSGERLPSLATAIAIIRVFERPTFVSREAIRRDDARYALDKASAGGGY